MIKCLSSYEIKLNTEVLCSEVEHVVQEDKVQFYLHK